MAGTKEQGRHTAARLKRDSHFCVLADNPAAVVCMALREFENWKANAEFIVRAWNSHYPLLEALEEARTQVESLQDRLGIKDTGSGTLAIIDAAISAARGRS